MLNEAYQNGVAQALTEIEKVAGVEFAEKVAGAKWDKVKSSVGGAKDWVKAKSKAGYEKGKSAGKNYGKNTAASYKRMTSGPDWKERGKGLLGVTGRVGLPAAAAGGAGYAGYRASKD